MTIEDKKMILEHIKAIDENLEALKKYQASLAQLKCEPDQEIGKQIKRMTDDINKLLDLIK